MPFISNLYSILIEDDSPLLKAILWLLSGGFITSVAFILKRAFPFLRKVVRTSDKWVGVPGEIPGVLERLDQSDANQVQMKAGIQELKEGQEESKSKLDEILRHLGL